MNVDRSGTSDHTRRWDLAIAGLAAVALAAVAAKLRFGIDDAFINFRFAENLAHGYGPVFNPGERVEGYTTPAWVFLLAALNRLGAPLLGTAHVLGIAAAAITVIATAAIATRAAPGLGGVAGAFAGLLVALHPGVLFWAASGMETTLFMLVLLLGFAYATLGTDARLAGFLCGLAVVTRPEAALFGLGGGLAIGLRDGWSALLRFALPFLALSGALEVFRLLYFGVPLPNTFYAKVGLQLRHGLWYLWQFLRDGGWIFGLGLLAVARPRRRVAATWLLVLGAYAAWIASIGGDVFAFHRFVVPVIPLLAILAALGADALLGRRRHLAAIALTALVLSWAGSLTSTYAYAWSSGRGVDGITRLMRPMGIALKEGTPPGTTVAMTAVGVIPFYAGPGVRVIDMLGLTDAHIARHGTRVGDGLPAHALYDNVYVFNRRPELVLVPPPSVWSSCRRALTASVVRDDPCATVLGSVGIETGRYGRSCPPVENDCPFGLPAEIDLMSPARRALFEADYERVAEVPGIGPMHAYRRRDWQPGAAARPASAP